MAAGGNIGRSLLGRTLGTWQAFSDSLHTSPSPSPPFCTFQEIDEREMEVGVKLEQGTGPGESRHAERSSQPFSRLDSLECPGQSLLPRRLVKRGGKRAGSPVLTDVCAEQPFLWQQRRFLCTDLEAAEEEVTRPGVGDFWGWLI
jgi:hypothetical protein